MKAVTFIKVLLILRRPSFCVCTKRSLRGHAGGSPPLDGAIKVTGTSSSASIRLFQVEGIDECGCEGVCVGSQVRPQGVLESEFNMRSLKIRK